MKEKNWTNVFFSFNGESHFFFRLKVSFFYLVEDDSLNDLMMKNTELLEGEERVEHEKKEIFVHVEIIEDDFRVLFNSN